MVMMDHKKDNYKKNSIMREMISDSTGQVSSKRVMGAITLVICMGCTIWLVISEGGTSVVENLLQTLMIMAAALLGISSVTGIWKKGSKVEIKPNEPDIKQSIKQTNYEDPEDPCETCIHNKKSNS